MTAEEIEIIINSDIPSFQKSALIKQLLDKKNEDVKVCKEGGELESSIEYNQELYIEGKKYMVAVAQSEEEKEIGLSKVKSLPKDCGMLFVYDSPQDDLWFTMEDTSIDLDIIFIDEDGEVTSVNSVSANDPNPIPDLEGNAKYVLEVNINSGIKVGDEIDDNSEDLSEDEKEAAKQSKMLVLDENGNVQMKLLGGERIISRRETVQLIKAVIKAYKEDSDQAYKAVGRKIFKILNNQDSRTPEYIQK